MFWASQVQHGGGERILSRQVKTMLDKVTNQETPIGELWNMTGWWFGTWIIFFMIYPIGSMYAMYGNMDPINIPHMLAYIPYMDPMGMG